MPTWFQSRIKYQQTDESVAVDTKEGSVPEAPKMKTVTETYLIDAVSYTDAEARTYKIAEEMRSEFEIDLIRPMRLSDVFGDNSDDSWYKCRTYYMTEDDKGRQKKVVSNMLVNASSVREAEQRLAENLSSMLVPVVITDINLTPILDVYPYEAVEAGQESPAPGHPAKGQPLEVIHHQFDLKPQDA